MLEDLEVSFDLKQIRPMNWRKETSVGKFIAVNMDKHKCLRRVEVMNLTVYGGIIFVGN